METHLHDAFDLETAKISRSLFFPVNSVAWNSVVALCVTRTNFAELCPNGLHYKLRVTVDLQTQKLFRLDVFLSTTLKLS